MISYIWMGMAKPSDRAAGWYNYEENVEKMFTENQYNIESTSNESKEKIKARIQEFVQEPAIFFEYYIDKIQSTWIEPTFQTLWINQPQEQGEVTQYISEGHFLKNLYDGKLSKIVKKYLDIFENIIFLFSLIYIITNFRKIGIKEISLLIIFLGGFLFHTIWETKSLYAIPFFIILLPYAAKGIEETFSFIEVKIKNHKTKELNK